MAMLSRSAEQRLADDHARSRRIVDEVAELPDDWPTLLFATSVDHAKYLAAMLNDRGIRVRRRRLDDQHRRTVVSASTTFREGRIRVLTNYGVLTQGFDAPATRAVVVARPVYSTNVYQQMIGRGLRGPRNGGKDTCLILNVSDNISQLRHRARVQPVRAPVERQVTSAYVDSPPLTEEQRAVVDQPWGAGFW